MEQKPVWMEDKLNLLERLTRLVGSNFFDLLKLALLVGMAIGLYTGYRLINAKIDSINKTVNPDETKMVIEKSADDIRIKSILDDLRVASSADRARMWQFHNGQKSVSGLSFLYGSVTHEVTGPGASMEIDKLQRLPSSMFAEQIEDYSHNKVRCVNVSQIDDSYKKDMMERERIIKSCSIGVFSSKNLVGFIAVNWVFNAPETDDDATNALRTAAIRIQEAVYTK